MKLHIVTASTRMENLRHVGRSIATAAPKWAEVEWHIRYDIAHAHVGGQFLKNLILDDIDDGYVYVLDDDTLMHPDLLTKSGWQENAGTIVSQARADGHVLRAHPANLHVGGVDIGQAVIRRDLIGDRRIPETYEGDGVFLAEVLAGEPGVRFVDEILSWHNALAGVPA